MLGLFTGSTSSFTRNWAVQSSAIVESEDNMPYIPQIKVGDTPYDVKDTEARDQISDLKSALYNEGIRAYPFIDTDNIFIESGYISPQGYNQSNDYFKRTPYIAVREGDQLDFTKLLGNTGVVGIWVFYNLSGVTQSALTSTGVYQSGTFTAPSDGYVRFSTNKTYLENGDASVVPHVKTRNIYGISSNSEKLNGVTSNELVKISWENGIDNYRLYTSGEVFSEVGYLNRTGGEQGNANFVRSTFIPVRANDEFTYSNLWGNTGAIGVIVTYDINQKIISIVESTGVYQTGTITIEQDGYIRFSTLKSYVDDGTTNVSKNGNATFADRFLYGRMYLKGVEADTLGDSITEQYGLDPSQTWQGQIKNQLGLENIANHGKGGSTVSALNNGMCTDARINELTGGSLIIVMGGVNDWAQNVPIGDKTYENENTSTFFGACNVMFRKLVTRFPSARIVAFGCTFAYFPDREIFTDKTGLKNDQGLLSVDYSKAMMESAQMNGIEHYDIGGNLNVNRENIANYFNDGSYYIHPNALGRYLIACFISKSLS